MNNQAGRSDEQRVKEVWPDMHVLPIPNNGWHVFSHCDRRVEHVIGMGNTEQEAVADAASRLPTPEAAPSLEDDMIRADYEAHQASEGLQVASSPLEKGATGFTAWERPPEGSRGDIVGVRELSDGRKEYLMHNEGLCRPYYLAVSEPKPTPSTPADAENSMPVRTASVAAYVGITEDQIRRFVGAMNMVGLEIVETFQLAQPASSSIPCVGCGGHPVAPNDPCAVCGSSSIPEQTFEEWWNGIYKGYAEVLACGEDDLDEDNMLGLQAVKREAQRAKDRAREAWNAAKASSPAELSPAIRMQLWLTHGCGFTLLYGDDGEMQCNRAPFIDFKRDSEVAILAGIAKHNEQRRLTETSSSAVAGGESEYTRGFNDCREQAMRIVDEHDGYLSRIEALLPPTNGANNGQ